jgi:hypothetical protein
VLDKAQNLLKKFTVNFVRKLIALASCAANGLGKWRLIEREREREKERVRERERK